MGWFLDSAACRSFGWFSAALFLFGTNLQARAETDAGKADPDVSRGAGVVAVDEFDEAADALLVQLWALDPLLEAAHGNADRIAARLGHALVQESYLRQVEAVVAAKRDEPGLALLLVDTPKEGLRGQKAIRKAIQGLRARLAALPDCISRARNEFGGPTCHWVPNWCRDYGATAGRLTVEGVTGDLEVVERIAPVPRFGDPTSSPIQVQLFQYRLCNLWALSGRTFDTSIWLPYPFETPRWGLVYRISEDQRGVAWCASESNPGNVRANLMLLNERRASREPVPTWLAAQRANIEQCRRVIAGYCQSVGFARGDVPFLTYVTTDCRVRSVTATDIAEDAARFVRSGLTRADADKHLELKDRLELCSSAKRAGYDFSYISPSVDSCVPDSRVKPLTRRRGSPWRNTSGDCESGHWIQNVFADGEIVQLEDGSLWKISSYDTVDTALWLPTSDVVVCDDKLINVDDGESVDAERIR